MTDDEYQGFREFLERACGILLGADKRYLVESRLNPLLGEFQVASLGQLIERVQGGRGGVLRDRIVDAMTTNETLLFRDAFPFEILRQVILPEQSKARAPTVRLWSAACSSGQEPYSISMSIEEFTRATGAFLGGVQILATDLSPSMLEQARAGVYDAAAMAPPKPRATRGCARMERDGQVMGGTPSALNVPAARVPVSRMPFSV